MHRSLLTLSIAGLLLSAAHPSAAADAAKPAVPAPAAKPAAKPAPKPPGLGLKDGDRVIFIGDSITHQCLYTQYVEDFYYTRYPNLHLHFRNAGVSGDRAIDALDRFDDDIASFKPTVATVLLGMNDASYKDFDPAVFATYAKDMTTLLDKLDALKVRVFLASPTMFDHHAAELRVAANPNGKARNPENYNAVLAYYGKWVQEIAGKRGYGFVDMYGPLNNLTLEERQKDKDFTFIPDAIHPQAAGQFIMGYSVIDAFGEPNAVWGITASASPEGNGWKISTTPGNTVTEIGGELGKSLTFTLAPKCLPWGVAPDAQLGATLMHAGHHKGNEALYINGLKPGRYDLVGNGKTIGTYDGVALSKRVEIEENPESPTFQQAQQVVALNKQRNDEAVRPMRDLYGKRKGELRKAKAAGDMKPFEAWWAEQKPKEAELMKKADEIEAQIYKTNHPAAVKFEIKAAPPLPAKAKAPAKPKAEAKAAQKKAA
ncbi:MAG: lipolytic enzyme [Verrucomicrobiaceae bacterium]|nr:lipolytic enzyme [Verrucomicrobiaceae bacterium]